MEVKRVKSGQRQWKQEIKHYQKLVGPHGTTHSHSAVAVLRLVVLPVGTTFNLIRPGAVLPVPLHRLSQTILENSGGTPPQLLLRKGTIDGIATVMAWAVGNMTNKSFRFAEQMD